MSIKNALTVDVEDWFQVSLLRHKIDRKDWSKLKSTVVRNTCRILEVLAEKQTQATFFVLGWVAERYPEIVVAIKEMGHEIASHGYGHQIIFEQSKQAFVEDVKKSLRLLEDIASEPVLGYRAPSYSITRSSLWAWETLCKLGLRYDSSIFPVKHDVYGVPDAPRFPFEIKFTSGESLLEFPLSTAVIWGNNVPMAGGGYLRLYPYWFIRKYVRRINEEGRPAIIYLHPWEMDPDLPRVDLGIFKKLRHYGNLSLMEERLRRLLDEFSFTTVKEVLQSTPIESGWPVSAAAPAVCAATNGVAKNTIR